MTPEQIEEALRAAVRERVRAQESLNSMRLMNVANWTEDDWIRAGIEEAKLNARLSGAKIAINNLTQLLSAKAAKDLTK